MKYGANVKKLCCDFRCTLEKLSEKVREEKIKLGLL